MVAYNRPACTAVLTAQELYEAPAVNRMIMISPFTLLFFFTIGVTEQQDSALQTNPTDSLRWNILVPASASMARAWEIPQNPTVKTLGVDSALGRKIVRGFKIFMNTPKNARKFSGGTMSCNNCHPNGGQREQAMPLVDINGVFPEYNKRAGRPFTLEDRIIGCFLRSVNATGSTARTLMTKHENELTGATLTPVSEEVQALAAYIGWLSSGSAPTKELPWRGQNTIPASALIPIEKLSTRRGKQLFTEKCSTCHGEDGQGVDIGDKRAGPLWGRNSWNDGAGAARTYTLAGIIRTWMPYLDPGSLTDEEAQQIAAYITSRPRPKFPYKEKDYLKENLPVDAVYYHPDNKNPHPSK